jgi:general secretion pathway protein G
MARMANRAAWTESSELRLVKKRGNKMQESQTMIGHPQRRSGVFRGAATKLNLLSSLNKSRMAAHQRGTTLVEVLIVVAIIAMVAGGVAFFAFPKFKEAQSKAAMTGARVIRGAAQNWQMTNDGCPTISQLIQDKQLDKAQDTNDPWGGDYNILCTDDDIVVSSDGADKKKGTEDDVSVPKVSSDEES